MYISINNILRSSRINITSNISKYLGYKTHGIFVEVGANDGKIGSFTYNQQNWDGGVYIRTN